MAADHLQRFVEDTALLPAELQRVLTQMRGLDEQAAFLQAEINAAVRVKIQKAAQKAKTAAAHRSKRTKTAPRPAQPLKLDEKLADDCRRVLALVADKAQLAQQIYNYVDERIRVTDAELRTFGNELARERKKLGLPPVVDVAGDLAGIAGSRKQSKAKQKREAEVAAAAVAPPDGVGSPSLPLLLPVQGAALPPFNPASEGAIPAATGDEPTYCYCQRVSYGDMIACDNPDCAIEWFHNVCVGIKPGTQLKGKWYCNDCAELKRAGKLS